MDEDGRKGTLALVRGIVCALVGAVLIVYGAVANPINAAVIVIVGLILLGVIALDVLPIGRRRP